MRIVVLGNEDSWYVRELSRAAQYRGHHCERGDFTKLVAQSLSIGEQFHCDQQSLESADAIIVRTMPPGSLEQVVFRMDVLQRLEAGGRCLLNPPKAIECAVDKFLTTSRLCAAGVPTPATVICETAEQALQAFEVLGGDVVVKPLFGAEGRGIMRVSDPDLALRAFRTIERLQGVLYLQQFIRHPGYDIRLLVLDGRVLGGMTRHNPQDFRTNVARHGTTALHVPTVQECHYALRACELTGARFAGIDLLYDHEGRCYVIEANAVPGWRAFARTTGIDVAGLVIEALEQNHCGRHPVLTSTSTPMGA